MQHRKKQYVRRKYYFRDKNLSRDELNLTLSDTDTLILL